MDNNKVNRYGKSMSDILTIKKKFFDENDTLLKKGYQGFDYSNLYRQQPKRKSCKICLSLMTQERYFINRDTNFYLCNVCGHLNGEFDDGMEYTKEIYESGMYGTEYQEPSLTEYIKRMDAIYIPKVKFMLDTLQSLGEEEDKLSYMDIGAGAGYICCALNRVGLDVIGLELSENQVRYANKVIGKNLLLKKNADEIVNKIKSTGRDVLIFINVFEHITNINEILVSIQENKKIKYIFFCVPLVSLACALEIVFPDVYARHLGGGGAHTHLFTQKSIAWIFDKYKMAQIASWTFGTDVMDLYRSIVVMLEKKKAHTEFINGISRLFFEQADAMQLLIDKSDWASDTHIIAKVH